MIKKIKYYTTKQNQQCIFRSNPNYVGHVLREAG